MSSLNLYASIHILILALVSAHDLLLNPGYFEEHDFVHVDELKHIIQKRSLNDDSSTEVSRQVRFMALGRDFRLMLKENKEILSPLFKAFLVDGEGNKVRPFNRIAQSEFYHGHLHGNPGSHVSGHIDSDSGLMTVSIQDNVNNESFMIEPLFRHRDRFVNRENSSNSSYMIIYKEAPVTDLFQDPNRYCDFVKFNDSEYASPTNDLRDNEVLQNTADESVEIKEENFPKRNRRAKREMDDTDIRKPQTRCNLYLVADHFFYLHMNKELKATISFMVTAIDRINKMFLDTPFGEPESPDFMTGLGFVIHEINVHESESKVDRHYNAPRKYIRVRDLLEAFSNNINLMHYCLGHLFTYRRFDGGVLGLAYVAHTKKYVPGGICSTGIERNGQKYYYNTGLTSFMNTLEQPINTRISDLVTAHELAHNWGAEHDPETIECSPSSSTGGSYIMHTYSVSGYDDYNRKFSPCSRRAMHNVLLNRAATCFLKPSKSYCGNGVVEEGEECDAGRFGEDEPDDCCNQTTCRLKEFAQCSDVNSLCCSFCKPAPLGTLCREASTITCQAPTVCDGKSSECPRFGPVLRDDTECIDGGRCNRGKCVSYCESIGKIPCLCDNPKFACRRCCRDGHRNTTCQPVDPIQILKDGTPCYNGVCERNGVCEKATQDVTLRLWGIIDRIDANSFARFLKDNIVGTVATILALIWIPICYCIKQFDRKQRLKRDEIRKSRKVNSTCMSRSFGARDPRNPGQRKHVMIRAGQGDVAETEPLNSNENGMNGRREIVLDEEDGLAPRPEVRRLPQEPFGPPQPDSVIFSRHRTNSTGSATACSQPSLRPIPSTIVVAPMAEPEEVNTPTSKTSVRSVML